MLKEGNDNCKGFIPEVRFQVSSFDLFLRTSNIVRRRIAFVSVLGLLAAFAATLPREVKVADSKGLTIRTGSHDDGPKNYDIRWNKSGSSIASLRTLAGRDAENDAAIRRGIENGISEFRYKNPKARVDINAELQTPEVIGTEIGLGRTFLTERAGAARPAILKNFLRENHSLLAVSPEAVDDLIVAADYTNPDGDLSFVELNQQFNGIPVFRGEVKAGFTKRGEVIRVINNLAPGIDEQQLSTYFGDAESAVSAAYRHIGSEYDPEEKPRNEQRSNELVTFFGDGDFATTAEKMYFPIEPGFAVPAWRVLIWRPVNAFYVVVDAATGTMLWRKNITEDQTQPATYNVYASPTGYINVANSPFPFWPGPTSPNGAQGAGIPRTNISRIGNEPPYEFNQLGWINDGVTKTDGNNVQAGLDRDGINGIDPNSEAFSPTREFVFSYSPMDPNTNTGENPVPAVQTYPGSPFQQGSVTQLFYTSNWFHNATYLLGFTEAARNFQNVNFTGQGLGGDRVSAEGQDSALTNNANFSTPADGGRGRMQMFIWAGTTANNGPVPNIDGNLDADVVIHELTHGLSNRLHGNSTGLINDMSRGMGEGWSDFFGMALLSRSTDPIHGIYTTGAYDTYRLGGTFVNNAYYGIRRFPTAVRSFTGGPNNRPHNPLTFADIDVTQFNISDGAFAPRFSGTPDQVHAAGEIWCNMLWEVRARFIQRLGWQEGNRRVLQFVIDGMKLSPLSPTFVDARDSIVAAALASGSDADVSDIWAGFATRGLGAGASVQNVGGTSTGGTGTARVTESFDLPNLLQDGALTIIDSNGNGVADPGEDIQIGIPLRNITGSTANGTTLSLTGGGSANYGNIASGSTFSQNVTFTVPPSTQCGSLVQLNLNVNSSLGPVSFTRFIEVGQPLETFAEAFDTVSVPNAPNGWAITSSYAPMTFRSTAAGPDTPPNSMFAANLPDCTSGCPTADGGSTELTTPLISITAPASYLSFRHRYNTEAGWDGGVLEISVGGGPFQDLVAAGGTFLQGGYNAMMGTSQPNPLGGRMGWTGNSNGYVTTIARFPAGAAGQNVQLRWRFGADNNTAPPGGGWNVDSIRIYGSFACQGSALPRTKFDFDGDGKTDISIFRPSDGNWWLNRSTHGVTVANFGLAEDIPAAGDFDGDSKTDIAVFRPSTGLWFRINSSNGTVSIDSFGLSGDIPQVHDYDGDGKDDIAIFRPSDGVWWFRNSGSGNVNAAGFGQTGDIPQIGDYDGDGRADITVFRPSNSLWYVLRSSNSGVAYYSWGTAGDIPASADFDGDGRDDIAIYRPDNGTWYWINSGSGQVSIASWGLTGDVPVPGDYDGDRKSDLAVYRNGVWYIAYMSGGAIAAGFGNASDIPIPRKQ